MFLALDLIQNEQVALKVLHRSPDAKNRFHRELSIYQHAHHPNLVSLRDAGQLQDSQIYFLALDYVDGQDFVSATASVSQSQFYSMIVQVLRGLDHLTRIGSCHGDLTPGNILATGSPAGASVAPCVKLVDFGIGDHDNHHDNPVIEGTPHYAAPETLQRNQHTISSDLYALGAILYECIAGHPPFEGPDIAAVVHGHITCAPPRLDREGTSELHSFIYQLLSKDPHGRPRSVREAWCILASLAPLPIPQLDTPDTWHALISHLPAISFTRHLEGIASALAQTVATGKTAPSCVLITGSSGAGKSRLLREATLLGYQSGFQVIDLPPRAILAGVAPSSESLQQLIPREPGRPLLLVFDDIDTDLSSSSIAVLIAELAGERPIVFLTTVNTNRHPPELAGRYSQQLRSLTEIRSIDLSPLTRAEISTTVCRGLRVSAISPALLDHLCRSTGGNPALLVASLTSYLSSGAIAKSSGSVGTTADLRHLPLPESIISICRSLLSTLDDIERAILVEMAVAFRPLPVSALSEIRSLDREVTVSKCNTLASKGIVNADPATDPPLCHISAGALAICVLHQLTDAELIDRHSSHASWHLAQPQTTLSTESATLHLVEARRHQEAESLAATLADDATGSHDYLRAERFYRIALAQNPKDPARTARLRLGLTTAELLLGQVDKARSTLDRLKASDSLPDPVRARVHVLEAQHAYLCGNGKHQELAARAALRLARLCQLPHIKIEAMLALGSSWCHFDRQHAAKRLVLRALKMARRRGLKPLVAAALHECAAIARTTGQQEIALKYASRRYRILASLGDHVTTTKSLGHIGLLLGDSGEYTKARRVYRTAIQEASSQQLLGLVSQLRNNLGEIERACGSFRHALQLYELSFAESASIGHEVYAITAKDNIAHVDVRTGFYQEALVRLKHLMRRAYEANEPHTRCNVLLGWSRLLILVGQYSAAYKVSDFACRQSELTGQNFLVLEAKTYMAEALSFLGKKPAARLLLEQALAQLRDRSSVESRFGAEIALANLTISERSSPTSFESSLDALISSTRKKQMRWHLTNALLLKGQLSLRANRAEDALIHLEEAAAIARRTGDRPSFWQATYHRGRAFEQLLRYEQALACYRVAALTVQEIGRDIEEERYRESFMAQTEVQAVLERHIHMKRQVGKKARRNLATMHRSEMISRKMLGALNTIGQKLTSVLDLNELLSLILDLSIENVRAERGIVFLRDEESGEMRAESARGMDRSDLEEASSFSRSVVQRAAEGQSLLAVDVNKDPSLSAYESLVIHEIKSILCVPMRSRGHVVGVIYLDTRRATQMFSEKERSFVESFASQAAVAIENAHLFGQMNSENTRLRREVEGRSRFESLIGSSPAMRELTHLMAGVLDSDCNVLILGESGTGKELVAKALHYNGPRRSKAFVAIDCGALPENLLEAELFGYARGAFTGADHDRVGLIEEANGGTLFLDEITNTTTSFQARLLRVLQEREVRRVGENSPRRVDLRIIAATNQNIRSLMKEGSFRQDLFYRLNVVTIDLPTLRERREDIPLLVEHFLRERTADDPGARRIAPAALRLLEQYEWPGNVRELQNAVERAVILSRGSTIGAGTIWRIVNPDATAGAHPSSPRDGAAITGEQLMIEEALRRCLGDKAKAARYIGWNRQKLYRRMKAFGIPSSYGKAA